MRHITIFFLLLIIGCSNPSGYVTDKVFEPAHTTITYVPKFDADLNFNGLEEIESWIPDTYYIVVGEKKQRVFLSKKDYDLVKIGDLWGVEKEE